MSASLLYGFGNASMQPLHSADNRLIYQVPTEYLYIEFKHYNSPEHPTSVFLGADVYDMDVDIPDHPQSSPMDLNPSRIASRRYSSSYSTFQDIITMRTNVNLVADNYHGFWACNAGVFRYEILLFAYRYLDSDNNVTQAVGHSENIEIRAYIGNVWGGQSTCVSNTKTVSSVPVFDYKHDGSDSSWTNIPPFPTANCRAATLLFNQEQRILLIT